MRTKTLLLTAALVAAGAASSMAQVYSVNVVGYVNKTLPKGFYMFANQLNNGTGNKVVDLIPAPAEGTFVYKARTGGGYTIIDFADGAWEGDDLNMTLAPGEGAFINSPASQNVTSVGEVLMGASSVDPHGGYQIVSSTLPTGGGLDTQAFPAVEGEFVYQFRPGGGYIINDYADGAWEGDSGGAAPNVAVGESFWWFVPTGAASTTHWSRNFTSN